MERSGMTINVVALLLTVQKSKGGWLNTGQLRGYFGLIQPDSSLILIIA